MKLKNLVLAAALSLPLVSLADDMSSNPFGGFYAGLGVGHTNTNAKVSTPDLPTVDFGNGAFAGQVLAGYNYAIDDNWLVGADAFFADNAGKTNATFDAESVTVKADEAYGLDAMVGYAFNQTAMVYLGGGWGTTNAKISGSSTNDSSRFNGWRAVAGTQQAFTDALSLRESVDYTQYESKKLDGVTVKPNQFTAMLSLIYTFNM